MLRIMLRCMKDPGKNQCMPNALFI